MDSPEFCSWFVKVAKTVQFSQQILLCFLHLLQNRVENDACWPVPEQYSNDKAFHCIYSSVSGFMSSKMGQMFTLACVCLKLNKNNNMKSKGFRPQAEITHETLFLLMHVLLFYNLTVLFLPWLHAGLIDGYTGERAALEEQLRQKEELQQSLEQELQVSCWEE